MSRRIILIAALLVSPSAQAHLMPSQQGTVNVVGDSVFEVLSAPVSALHGFDDDGDGVMSAAEMQRHGKALREELDRRFVVRDGETVGKSMAVDLVLSPEHGAPTDRSAYVVVLKHTQFAQPPEALRVSCDLFGAHDSERQLTITATRPGAAGKETEVATLTPGSTEHRFFRSPSAAFGGFRAEHLLLLLAVIAVGLGWRHSVALSGARAARQGGS